MKKRIGIAALFLCLGIGTGILAGNRSDWQRKEAWMAAAPVALVASKEPVVQDLKLYAMSAVLMDADSGRVLYGKDETTFRPMASTTKIMTCILALENGQLDDICTFSKSAASQPKVHLGAGTGSRFYLKDLLYSLMLESHNDTAVAVAEQIGGSVEGFAALMNQKARDIGCENTYFITPNGLDASVTSADGTELTHGTTAADLARIMRYCILESPKKEEFLEITRTGNYSFADLDGKRSFQCTNHNALLTMMDGAISGKTGFTGGAGYSYVGALGSEGRTYVIALLGSGWPPHKTYKWSDARTLFQYGMEQYQYRDVFTEPVLSPVPVQDGILETEDGRGWEFERVQVDLTMNLAPEEKEIMVLLKDQEEVKVKVDIKKSLEAPVLAGDLAGHVTFELDGEIIRTYPVYTKQSIDRRNLFFCIRQVIDRFFFPEGN